VLLTVSTYPHPALCSSNKTFLFFCHILRRNWPLELVI